MGGSGGGGGFFSSFDSEDFSKKLRDSELEARSAVFDAELSKLLGSLLTVFNDRDVEGIQRILEIIREDILRNIDGAIDLLFGGSVAKHTYVDGLSDVDTLVLFDREDTANKSPAELRQFLSTILTARFGHDSVYEGKLAVTLTIDGKQIQFLPAARAGSDFKIASSDGESWSRIKPTNFANALTKANKLMDGKLVPCIKLAKAILSNLPEQRKVTGYHVESMAIDIFRNYQGEHSTSAMLRHFFEKAPEVVLSPIKDRSGQSVHVDDYLGEENSLSRRIVSDALGRIARRVRNADGSQSIDAWRDLFS